jgi:hypothetical protein
MLLLVLFSFSLMTPLLSAGSDAQLPPCCRRDGHHACGMKKPAPVSSGVTIRQSSRCSLYGKGGVTPAAAKAIPAPAVTVLTVAAISHPSAIEQTEARYRISFSRSRQKRGPPALLS